MRLILLIILSCFSYIIFSQDTLTVRQVFDFDIGDEFHYEENFSDYLPTSNILKIERIKIIDKYLSANKDTLFYKRLVDGYTYYFASPPPDPEYKYKYHTYEDTVHYTDLDSTIFYYMVNGHFAYLKDYDWQQFDTLFDRSDSTVYNSESFCFSTLNGYQFSDFPVNHQVEFGKGIGLTKEYKDHEECMCTTKNINLIFFKKGVDLCGFPDNHTDPNQNEGSDSVVDTNKVWYTFIYIYCCEKIDTEVIGFSEDTIINDTTYYRVLRSTGGNINPYQNYGLIREDTNHRIYYKTAANKPDRLIYDFSISEGDSINVFGLMDWEKDDFISCNYICDSIRSKEYYGVQRKVYYLSTSPGHYYEYWIEGLGSSSGLLHNFDGRVGGDAFYFACVMFGDSILFKKYETCVRIALNVDEKKLTDPLFFPNPVRKNQELNIIGITPGSVMLLYSSMGKLVHRKILDSSENSIQIDLETGIYLYHIIENKKGIIHTGRLIFE